MVHCISPCAVYRYRDLFRHNFALNDHVQLHILDKRSVAARKSIKVTLNSFFPVWRVSVAARAVKESSCFRNLLIWFCALRSISEVKQHLCLWTCIEFLYVVRRELFLCIRSWFKEATDVQLMYRVYLYIVARGTVAFTGYLGADAGFLWDEYAVFRDGTKGTPVSAKVYLYWNSYHQQMHPFTTYIKC